MHIRCVRPVTLAYENSGIALSRDEQSSVDITEKIEVIRPKKPSRDAHRKGAHFATPSEDEREKNHKPARGAKVALGVLGGVAAVYLGGVVVWSNVFMPNTKINGADVSLATVGGYASANDKKIDSYELKITGDNVVASVSASEIGLKIDGTAIAQEALRKTNPWAWPVVIFTGSRVNVSASTSFDEDKLAQIISAATEKANEGASDPVDAAPSYNSESKKFEIKPEVLGTKVDDQAVIELASNAMATGTETLELGPEALMKPSVTHDSQDLAQAVEKANQYLAASQTLTAGGSEVAKVGADEIAQWVRFGDNYDVTIDTDALAQWANDSLGSKLNTVGSSRTYTRADGKKVTVTGGTYGWSVDTGALAQTLAKNIQECTEATTEVNWTSSAAVWNPGGADWGKRYIDCDLSEQHARMYDESGNLIWESDFVSGDVSEGRKTPEGVYTINSNKGMNQTLKGLDENGDGKPDYESKVTYWMPFVTNLVAFHDASWRSRFGGSIYQTNGSHGCVNLPTSAAKSLYDLTKVGDVVVSHY